MEVIKLNQYKNITDLSPHERIKIMRSHLNLTQTDLGEKIGLAQSTIGLIEKGTRTLTDRVLSDICRTCNINKEWILNGTGEMQVFTMPSAMEQLCQEFNLNEFDANLVYEYLKLSPENRTVIRNFINKIADTSPYNEFPANPSALIEEPVKHRAI